MFTHRPCGYKLLCHERFRSFFLHPRKEQGRPDIAVPTILIPMPVGKDNQLQRWMFAFIAA